MKAYMQKFAQSLMLPISILPVAGLLLGIASFIDSGAINGEGNSVANFLASGGLAVIDSLPILFAVGLAFGMSKDKNGAAALSGLRSEEHTSELQSRFDLVCRLLLEKKKHIVINDDDNRLSVCRSH